MKTRISMFLIACCAWLSACGGSSPVSQDNYCQKMGQIICQAADRCDCLTGELAVPVSTCVNMMVGFCDDSLMGPVHEGRMSFDADAASACLDAMKSAAADCKIEDSEQDPRCNDMLTGAVTEGGACDYGDECLPVLTCDNEICTAFPGDGEPCQDYMCMPEHYCGSDEVCHAQLGQGGDCPGGDYYCQDDLYCDSRDNTCQNELQENDDCSHATYACDWDDDLYCSPSSSTCKAYPTAGGDCADSSGNCAWDHWCDPNNVCQEELDGGEPCTEDDQCKSWGCIDGFCEDDGGPDCDLF